VNNNGRNAQENVLADHLDKANLAAMVTGVTELMAKIAKGEGAEKAVRFERDMPSHTLEKYIGRVKAKVSLLPSMEFKKNSNVLVVNKHEGGGEDKLSREVSRALVRALTASCLGVDLRHMVETHNNSVSDTVTFDELVKWMKGEVGGKYPLTSYRDGLKGAMVGKVWTLDVLHLRFTDMRQMMSRVASTIGLYIMSHREYLLSKVKLYSGENVSRHFESEVEAMVDDSEESKEELAQAKYAVWLSGEYDKLEAWMRPNTGTAALFEKAQNEAKLKEEERKEAVARGEEPPKLAPNLAFQIAESLMNTVRETVQEIEERGKEKMREFRSEFLEQKGAGVAPSAGKGLRVSLEKLKFQEENVCFALFWEGMIDWIVLEGDKHSRMERLEVAVPYRLTDKGRGSVLRLCLPTWLRKKLKRVNESRGCNQEIFEFACKQVMTMMEDEKSSKAKAQPTKGQGGVSVSAVSASGPTASSSSNPKQDKKKTKVSSTSAEGKVDRVIECRRHTIAKEKFNDYSRAGRGLDLPGMRREKFRWLLKDAEALGYTLWAQAYDKR
jgi:hypothetical protein